MAEDVTFADLETVQVNYYLALVAITILFFDYGLTFADEVHRFWKVSRLSWASGFFYLNRYMVLLGHIPVMIEYFWTTSSLAKMPICHRLQTFHQYLAIVIQLVVACMLIMRMYALYERNRWILGMYIGVSAIVVTVGCWSIFSAKKGQHRDVYIPIGCGANLTNDQAIRLGAAWSGMLVFDCLVFGMTLYKSLTLPRLGGANLLSVLLRDGAIYFGVMVACNLANIVTFVLGGPFTRGVMTTFTNIISSVMISRLMLNLRHPSLVAHKKGSSAPTGTDDLAYPNLTFIEAQHTTQDSDGGGSTPKNGRYVYDYLTRGPGRPVNRERDSIELGPLTGTG